MVDDSTLSCCLIVFAKAPIEGRVKTRMSPVLGEEQARQLHCQLVRHLLSQIRGLPAITVELWCDQSHPFISACAEQFAVSVHYQQGEGLGERMCHALNCALARYDSVVIVGSDCPFIDVAYLQCAFEYLRIEPGVVLGPAADGGYVLLGLNQIDKRLFEHIDWGTSEVLEQTQQRLNAIGWAAKELPVLQDIDRPEDLPLLQPFAGLRHWVPFGVV